MIETREIVVGSTGQAKGFEPLRRHVDVMGEGMAKRLPAARGSLSP